MGWELANCEMVDHADTGLGVRKHGQFQSQAIHGCQSPMSVQRIQSLVCILVVD